MSMPPYSAHEEQIMRRHYPHWKAAEVARAMVGASAVDADARPLLASEDFASFLAERPGAFVFIGNGESAPLHSPRFDFADDAIPFGVDFLCRLDDHPSASVAATVETQRRETVAD